MWVACLSHDHFDLILHFYCVRTHCFPSLCQILALIVTEILGVPTFKNWVTGPSRDHFWPFFCICCVSTYCNSSECQNLQSLASFIPEILRESQNSKSGSRDPNMTLLTKFCILSLVFTAVHLCAKFEVSSFIRPWYIRGLTIPKMVHLTPHDPFGLNSAFLAFVLTASHLCAIFEVSYFIWPR